MNEFALLLDENVPHVLRDQLWQHNRNLNVVCVGEQGAPPISAPDPKILDWLEANGYLLITLNRSSMPIHLRDHLVAGGHVPGILAIRPHRSISEIVDELLLIVEAAKPSEFQDQITYLPL